MTQKLRNAYLPAAPETGFTVILFTPAEKKWCSDALGGYWLKAARSAQETELMGKARISRL